MAIETRGGVPRVFRGTITTGGYDATGHRFAAVTKHVRIRNYGANVLRIYFTAAHYTADTDYVEIAASGVLEGPMELDRIWLRSVTGSTDIEMLSFLRHG